MSQLMNAMRSFMKEEDGATMVEYGLLVALIAVVVAVAAVTLGSNLATKFTTAANCVATATTAAC